MKIILLKVEENKKNSINSLIRQNGNVLEIDIDMIRTFLGEKSDKDILRGIKKYIEYKANGEEYILIDSKEKDFLERNNLLYEELNLLNLDNVSIKYALNKLTIKKHLYGGELKKPEQFDNIPLDYQNSIKSIYDEFIKSEDIAFMLVTGSGNRGCVYDKWSDIDLIIVVENENNQKIRDYIDKVTSNQKVKVGTTVYSKNEFETLFVDYKTLGAIYDLNCGKYKPTICSKTLNIPYVDNSLLINGGVESLSSMMHSLRRGTYPNAKINYITLFKDLSHLMRNIEWSLGIFPTDYQDVSRKFSEEFGIEFYDANSFLKSRITGVDVEEENKELIRAVNIFLDFMNKKYFEGGKNEFCKIKQL